MAKPPRFIGVDPKATDAVIKRDSAVRGLQDYKAGIAARAAKTRESRPKIPNLAQAEEQYKPARDGAATLAKLGEIQRAVDDDKPKDQLLSPETVAGLRALHDAVAAQRAKEGPPVESAQVETPEPKAEPKKVERVETPEDVKTQQIRERVSDLDDFEFDRVMRGIQTDAINNDKEREAVKKRVKDIDLADGLSTGEFTQEVPIVPGKLTVWYRSISSVENQAIRLLLFKWVDVDPRKENISAELYSLMQLTASVTRINGNTLPRHLKGTGMYDSEFDEDAFEKKFKLFVRYPMPLIHAIGVHGFWFDARVRDLFTTENVKNG